jgi:hypothetical protein
MSAQPAEPAKDAGDAPRVTLKAIDIPERISSEYVAYDLMRDIMFDDPTRPEPRSAAFRAYVLDLYAECLSAVRGTRRPAGADQVTTQVPKPVMAPAPHAKAEPVRPMAPVVTRPPPPPDIERRKPKLRDTVAQRS